MKSLLLLTASLLACLSYGQSLNPTLGFVTDIPTGGAWYPEYGGRIGLGVHNIQMDSTPFYYSLNLNTQISGSRRNTHIDQVLFDMDNTDEQAVGFARAEFQKTAISFDYDFGYGIPFGYSPSNSNLILPYVSIGPRIENYRARAHYELYPRDTCDCTEPTKLPVSSNWSLGTNIQTGVKFMFYGIGFDIRAGYYMGWTLGNTNTNYLPIVETFHIDPYGVPQFDYKSSRFNGGFNFSISLIFKFNSHSSTSRYYEGPSFSSGDDDDDSDDDDDGGSSSSGSSSGSSSCGGGLSPAGRGGG